MYIIICLKQASHKPRNGKSPVFAIFATFLRNHISKYRKRYLTFCRKDKQAGEKGNDDWFDCAGHLHLQTLQVSWILSTRVLTAPSDEGVDWAELVLYLYVERHPRTAIGAHSKKEKRTFLLSVVCPLAYPLPLLPHSPKAFITFPGTIPSYSERDVLCLNDAGWVC